MRQPTNNKETRRYYAVEWIYGRLAWWDGHGMPSFAIYFETAEERDQWVANGNPDRTQPGNREALTPSEVLKRRLHAITLKQFCG